MSERDVRHKLSVIKEPKARLKYLDHIRRKEKLLEPSTRRAVNLLYGEAAGQVVGQESLAAEAYIKSGMKKEDAYFRAAESAERNADLLRVGTYDPDTREFYRSAALDYKQTGTKKGLIKAAGAYEKAGSFIEAANAYKKAGMTDKEISDTIEEHRKRKFRSKLETTAATSSIISLLGGIFFLSSNLTGNVIGNMTNSTSNWIGGILFAVGLIGAFVYFKKK